MKYNCLKKFAVTAGDRINVYRVGRMALRLLYGGSYIRAVNYHELSDDSIDNFRVQLEFFRDEFVNSNLANLRALTNGHCYNSRPGIILSFDDGLLSHYEITAPILEEYGFIGWFFVPVRWLSSNNDAANKNISGPRTMSKGQVLDLVSRGHIIGCHTLNHVRLSDDLSIERLEQEIALAKIELEDVLGVSVDIFCWVGGEEYSYSKSAYKIITEVGYKWTFMTNCSVINMQTSPHWLDRTNIESDWSIDKVRFYLSGIMDLAYTAKRRRLRRKILPIGDVV